MNGDVISPSELADYDGARRVSPSLSATFGLMHNLAADGVYVKKARNGNDQGTDVSKACKATPTAHH